MITTRRILAFLMVCVLMVVGSGFTVTAYTDVPESNGNYLAINTLSNIDMLKGYPDDTFKPDASITRAEFTALVVRVLGLGDITGLTGLPFSDVADTHWAYSNIKMGCDLKLLDGFPDGTFQPDSTITYEQAVKVLVATLGYTSLANTKGGYPLGYIAQASELGLLENAQVANNGASTTRGIVAQIVYNALEVRIAEESGGQITVTNKTLLKDYLNLIKIFGQIDANQYTSLVAGGTAAGKDSISVNGTKLKLDAKYAGFQEKLGQYATVYYRPDSAQGVNSVRSIVLQSNYNTTLEVNARDIDVKSGATFTYWPDAAHMQKTVSVTIPASAKIIYNEKAISYSDFVSQNLMPDMGKITLVDTSGDGAYDVAVVKSYKNYVVQYVSGQTIYNELDKANPLVVPENGGAYTVKITNDGREVLLSSIKKNDILSIAKSNDSTYMEILVTSKSIAGKITRISGEKITVNGTEYQYSKELTQYLQANNVTALYNVNTNATFYLDAAGKISWYYLSSTSTDSQVQYGYLINAGIESDWDDLIEFRIYTSSGIKTYEGAQRIKLDGTNNMPYASILQRLEANALQTNMDVYDPINPNAITDVQRQSAKYAQIIRYTLNDKNQITYIDTITAEANEGADALTMPSPSIYDNHGLEYNASARNFENKVTVDSTTKVFYIPTNRYEESSYAVKSISSFMDKKSYMFEVFDLSVTKIGKVLVLYGGSDDYKVTVASPLTIVRSVSEEYYQDESVQKLTGMTVNGQSVTYYAQLGVLDGLKEGQIIRFGVDNAGKITNYYPISMEYDPYSETPPALPASGSDYNTPLRYKEYNTNSELLGSQGNNFNAYYRTLFATVYSADETSILLSSNLPTENVELNQSTYTITGSTKFIVFDKTKLAGTGAVEAVSTEVALAYMKQYHDVGTAATSVFTYSQNGQLRMVYIMKE